MKRFLILASLTAGLALPLVIAPASANATCRERRTTGTVVGGVGGALVGHALIGGPVGLIAGGLGGAVAGHEVAGAGCHTAPRSARYAQRAPYPQGGGRSGGPAAVSAPAVYYDQYGHPVGPGTSAPAATSTPKE